MAQTNTRCPEDNHSRTSLKPSNNAASVLRLAIFVDGAFEAVARWAAEVGRRWNGADFARNLATTEAWAPLPCLYQTCSLNDMWSH